MIQDVKDNTTPIYSKKNTGDQTFRKPAKYSRTFGPANDQFSQDRKTFPRTELCLLVIREIFLPLSGIFLFNLIQMTETAVRHLKII